MGMCNIISGDEDMITKAMFGKPLVEAQNYMADSVNRYASALGTASKNLSSGFYNNIMDKFNSFHSSEYMHKLNGLRNKMDSLWQTDSIRPLESLSNLQQAPHTMQRWVMANPKTRELFLDSMIDGYSDTYVDIHPNQGVGQDHYDYRRVMDGVLHKTDDNKVVWKQYTETLLTSEDILTIFDKSAIMNTWQCLETELEKEELDPTSLWNNHM